LNLEKQNNQKKYSENQMSAQNKQEESNSLGIKRDQETLDKEKKKKKNISIFDVVNKMNEKIKIESTKKFTDSDEEILDEVKQLQEKIGKEIEDEMKTKTEEFKKIALKNSLEIKERNSDLTNKNIGGLITNNKNIYQSKNDENYNQQNTCFEEIISNITQGEFDINKYSEINKVLSKKNEVKWDKRNQSNDIDYSKGGLQTFEKNKKTDYGLILNSNKKEEEEYFDEEENEINNLQGDIYQDSYLNRKRDRELNSNPYLDLAKKKVYGVVQKPKSRNIEEEKIDENDYEAFYMIEDKYKVEHDINNSNPYKKEYED